MFHLKLLKQLVLKNNTRISSECRKSDNFLSAIVPSQSNSIIADSEPIQLLFPTTFNFEIFATERSEDFQLANGPEGLFNQAALSENDFVLFSSRFGPSILRREYKLSVVTCVN